MSRSLDAFATEKLDGLEARGLRRHLTVTERTGPIEILRGGRRLISFSCNDYLNLSQHPALKQAAKDAVDRLGVGSGASRLVTGDHPLLPELEARLARLKGTEDCCVMGSGFLTNTGVIPALIAEDDLVLADELSHACIIAGGRLSKGTQRLFRHNDLGHLRDLLAENRADHPRCLIATDGVFSMDGDLAPVHDMAALAAEFDAWLLTDDAHGIGVVGAGGRGSTFAGGTKAEVDLQMGTLSKAVGGYGGYLCASKAVIDLMKTRCRTLIYSTGLPPATVAAAIAALDIIEGDPEYAARPLKKARRFTTRLGLPPAESPIVPILLGDTARTMAAQSRLESAGYLVVGIRPPTVPEGTARLRLTFTARHEDADIDRLADLIAGTILTGEKPFRASS
ncbi:MAG: 8-amino-7-oxononanoate synthase [Rhodospirillales bacterium CG15_BIG_FIL_POST_REV_8_21_14_020_66_15]|nr:MAG: 8-amino-7-oxononanoate synthase [Rhodospirillales bacterium CG15_BIG_FIL_POST_REV_8_21_14_020_66_15]